MPDFGEEFLIESFKVSWLIWIQLIVTVLIILLLFFGFTSFTLDYTSSSSAAASPSTGAAAAVTVPPAGPRKPLKRAKVGDQRVPRDEETREVLIGAANQTEEESPLKDSGLVRKFQFSNHPCNYFGLAKQALFKCFGLDSGSETSRRHQHEKQE